MNSEQLSQITNELKEYIDQHCTFRCNPSVNYVEDLPNGVIATGTPGKHNNRFQFMMRRLTHHPKMLWYVSAILFDKIITSMKENREYESVQLCGLETSSIPIIIGIQQCAVNHGILINSFSIRKERKSSGLFHMIDGIPTNAPVIVVDDVINSGSSIYRCLETCFYELQLIPAKNCYSIMSFNKQLTELRRYKEYVFSVNSLFKREDFNTGFDPSKYWLPADCDRSYNKRPEYQQKGI